MEAKPDTLAHLKRELMVQIEKNRTQATRWKINAVMREIDREIKAATIEGIK